MVRGIAPAREHIIGALHSMLDIAHESTRFEDAAGVPIFLCGHRCRVCSAAEPQILQFFLHFEHFPLISDSNGWHTSQSTHRDLTESAKKSEIGAKLVSSALFSCAGEHRTDLTFAGIRRTLQALFAKSATAGRVIELRFDQDRSPESIWNACAAPNALANLHDRKLSACDPS